MKKNILLFPGCFDPFHIQHKNIVENLKKNKKYDEFWILINKNSKEKNIIVDFKHRLKMVELNISQNKRVKIFKEPIGFFTQEMIKNFKEKNKEYSFSLILGMDQVNNLLNWKNSEELNKLTKIVAIPRKNFKFNKKVENKYEVELIKDLKINHFNSTEIRTGKSWNFLTKISKKYIIEKHLYFENILKNNMSNKRFIHSIEVAKLSKKIANFYNLNQLEEMVYIAGLFHDLTKEWDEKKHLCFLKKLNLNLNLIKKIPFPIWHSKTSVLFLKNNLKILNKNILDAIKFHTTAKKNMNDLSKILYIADKLEISKTGLNFEELKKILKNNSLCKIFKQTLFKQVEKIKNKGLKLTKIGKEAFDFYLSKK